MSSEEANEIKKLTEVIQNMRFQELHQSISYIRNDISEIKAENKEFRERIVKTEQYREGCPIDLYRHELQRYGRETRTIRVLGDFFNRHPRVAWMAFFAIIILLAAAIPSGIHELMGLFNGD